MNRVDPAEKYLKQQEKLRLADSNSPHVFVEFLKAKNPKMSREELARALLDTLKAFETTPDMLGRLFILSSLHLLALF